MGGQRRPPKEHGTRQLDRSDIIQRPPVNRMTHGSKNITMPQTSFAGGNKGVLQFKSNLSKVVKCLKYLYCQKKLFTCSLLK